MRAGRQFQRGSQRARAATSALCAGLLAAALAAGQPAPAAAGTASAGASRAPLAKRGEEAAPGAHAVFEALAQAWQAEDHAALAARVADEGIDIAVNLATGARNHYSSRQAFYFFKNLFQTTQTVAFHFTLLQDKEADAGTTRALAEWSYRRSADGDPVAERLVFSLSRGDGRWALVSIRAIR